MQEKKPDVHQKNINATLRLGKGLALANSRRTEIRIVG
jgi:hypothetical protein